MVRTPCKRCGAWTWARDDSLCPDCRTKYDVEAVRKRREALGPEACTAIRGGTA